MFPALFLATSVLSAVALLAFSSLVQAGFMTGQNFTGSTFRMDSNFIPPDSMGAVGPEHFVELINGRYAVYDKNSGVRVQTSSLDDFWTGAGVTPSGPFANDPRVLYDYDSQRWFATSADNPGNANNFLLAVSNSSNPTRGWTGFAIDSNVANTRSADFPTLGIDADGVYLAANMFDLPGGPPLPLDVTVVSVPKADLLLPTPTVANRTSFEIAGRSARGFAIQPVVDFGPSDGQAALLAVDFEFFGLLNRTNVLNAAGPGATLSASVNIGVPPTSFPPNAFQPDGSSNLETGDDRFSSSVYEVGDSLWAAHSITVASKAGIRWYEIDESTNAVLQFGTISDPDRDYFYPSIAANESGDVVIGFSGSSASQFVSSYAVVGETESGMTAFGDPLLLQAGLGNYEILGGTGRNRWGDYSATTVDPTDPFSFWTIQEWVSADNTWSTQITEIIIVPETIPEPSTLLLLASGLGGLGAIARRRKFEFGMDHPQCWGTATQPSGPDYSVLMADG